MLNKKMVAYNLRKIADKIENKNQIKVDMEDYDTWEKIKNFTGEVIVCYHLDTDDEDESYRFTGTNLTYKGNGILGGTSLSSSDNIWSETDELVLDGFSKIELGKGCGHCSIKNSSNITSSDVQYVDFSSCKNINFNYGSFSGVSFEKCSQIKIDKFEEEYGLSLYFDSCKDIEFGFDAPEGNDYDIEFKNCSGYIRHPGHFWAKYENCNWNQVLHGTSQPKKDEKDILEQINQAIQKNPKLLEDFCKETILVNHDGWYDGILTNTSLDKALSFLKKKIEKEYFEDKEEYDEDDFEDSLAYFDYQISVPILSGINSKIFYYALSADGKGNYSLCQIPQDVTLLPSEDDNSETTGKTYTYRNGKWSIEIEHDIYIMLGGSGHGGQYGALYREDFIRNKDFFLK